jgi:gliding motility-associated-like protein
MENLISEFSRKVHLASYLSCYRQKGESNLPDGLNFILQIKAGGRVFQNGIITLLSFLFLSFAFASISQAQGNFNAPLQIVVNSPAAPDYNGVYDLIFSDITRPGGPTAPRCINIRYEQVGGPGVITTGEYSNANGPWRARLRLRNGSVNYSTNLFLAQIPFNDNFDVEQMLLTQLFNDSSTPAAPTISLCSTGFTSLPETNISVNPNTCFANVNWRAQTEFSDPCNPSAVYTLSSDFDSGTGGDWVLGVGSYNITITADDGAGNIFTELIIVNITDTNNPTIVGMPGDVVLTSNAIDCGATHTWNVPEAFDVCPGMVNLTSTHQPGDFFPAGVTEVTYTATDFSGNVTEARFTVTVETPLVVEFVESITLPLTASNPTTVQVLNENLIESISENCGDANVTTQIIGNDTFGCNGGVLSVQATNSLGVTFNGTIQIFAEDIVAPSLTVQNVSAVIPPSGELNLEYSEFIVAATDNCDALQDLQFSATIDGTTVNFNDLSNSLVLNCDAAGTSQVIQFTVTDLSGNTSSIEEAELTIAPADQITVNTQDVTVSLNSEGLATITPNDVVTSAFISCSDLNFSLSRDTFTCADIGLPITVNLTVSSSDNSVADVIVPITVMVEDNLVGQTNLENETFNFSLNNLGNFTLELEDVIDNTFSNCFNYSLTRTEFNCEDIATNPNVVGLNIIDANSNNIIQTVNFNVNIQDLTPPDISNINRVTFNISSTETATLTPADFEDDITDNCSGPISINIIGPTTFSVCDDIGLNFVLFRATDVNGNFREGSVEVLVIPTDETVTAQALNSIDVNITEGSTVSISAQDIDNGSNSSCNSFTLSTSQSTFSCSDVVNSPITVTLTATTLSGVTSTATTQVNVNYLTPLNLDVAQSVTLELDADGEASLSVEDVVNNLNEFCFDQIVLSKTSFSCNDIGSQDISLSGEDLAGNTFSETITVNTLDNLDPEIVLINPTGEYDLILDLNGEATLQIGDIDGGSSDNCNLNSQVFSRTNFTCADVAQSPIDVTYTVTDNSGNSVTENLSITVKETINVSTIPQQTVQIGTNGLGSISLDLNDFIEVSCGPLSNAIYNDTFDCADLEFFSGVANLNFTPFTAAGTNVPVSIQILLLDEIDPEITNLPAGNLIEVENDEGECGAIVNYNSPIFSDNCEVSSQSNSHPSGTFFTIGSTTVTLTANDPSGNTTIETFTVVVSDTEDPVITGMPAVEDLIVVQSPVNCTAEVSWIEPTANDNCGIASFTSNFTPGVTLDLNVEHTLVYTAIDDAGNEAEATLTFTLFDDFDPVIQNVPSNIIVNNAAGECGAEVTWNPITFADNCGVVETSTSFSSGDFFPVGETTVQITAEDAQGNKANASFTVTVNDTENPVILNMPTELDLVIVESQENCEATVTWTPPTAEDNCGVVNFFSNYEPGVVLPLDDSYNLTYTAIDEAGNLTSVSLSFTLEDNTPPIVTQFPPSEYFVNNQNCQRTVNWIQGLEFEDNCGGVVTFEAISDLPLFDQQALIPSEPDYEVSFRLTDERGNSAIYNHNFRVLDTISPTITGVPADITIPTSANSCEATFSFTNPDISDNCPAGISTVVDGVNSSNTYALGENVVTFTVFDLTGNVTVRSFTITVVDQTPPVIPAQNFTAELDENGEVTITLNDVLSAPITDNCNLVFTDISKTVFNCDDIGENLVEITARDEAGNETTVEVSVFVEDNLGPEVIGENAIVQLDATGNFILDAAILNNRSSDNCTDNLDLTFEATPNIFTCDDLGENDVVFTVFDEYGNSNEVIVTVTVEDVINPVAVGQNIEVFLNNDGIATVDPNLIDNGSTDNCQNTLNFSLSQSTFTCDDLGDNIVDFIVTDAAGNFDVVQVTVSVIDNINPVAIPNGTVQVFLDETGTATLEPASVNNNSTDNCSGNLTFGLSRTVFTCDDLGTPVLVQFSATDASGNTGAANVSVFVLDQFVPIVETQNINVELDANGEATITPEQIDAGSQVSCGEPQLSLDITAFDCSNVGENTVTLSVVGNNGIVNTKTATVTVIDVLAPVVEIQNITVFLNEDGVAEITPADIDNGSADNCTEDDALVFDLSQTIFDCNNLFAPVEVTLTVTDEYGNFDSATALVTVVDEVAPIAMAQNLTLQLDENGEVNLTAEMLNNGSTDNCTADEDLVFSIAPEFELFTCTDIGAAIEVMLTVTDDSGNSNTAIAEVTIIDELAPVVEVQNITVFLNEDGVAEITPADIDNGSADNCTEDDALVFDLSQTIFDCNNLFAPVEVTLTVTDEYGNFDSATALVTVVDEVAPIAMAQNLTLQLDENGEVNLTAEMLNNGSTDNCTANEDLVFSIAPEFELFTCADIGAAIEVVLTVTDESGNSSTATAEVTIIDDLAPVVEVQNINVSLNEDGIAEITPADIDNGSADNCTNEVDLVFELSQTIFDCDNLFAPVEVTLTVTDEYGNFDSATALVTVVDELAPIALAQNLTLQLNENGEVNLSAEMLNNGSTDNCTENEDLVFSIAPEFELFTCADIGAAIEVVLTVTDESGNSSTVAANVSVIDNLAPEVSALSSLSVSLNEFGEASLSAVELDNGTTDNCTDFANLIFEIPTEFTSFDCTDAGNEYEVTLTVTDESGNSAEAIALVSVVDDLAPVAQIIETLTVSLNAEGEVAISIDDLDLGSTDNCTLESELVFEISQSAFDCSNLFEAVEVTTTITDNFGNSATANTIVTVVDDIAPVLDVLSEVTLSLDENGQTILTRELIDVGTTDNCTPQDDLTFIFDVFEFDCDNIDEPITVNLTVLDESGNLSNSTIEVTIEDNLAPIAIAQETLVVALDETGLANITVADINNGSNDNCTLEENLQLSLDIDSFTCEDLFQEIIVTLTVVDENGNTSTATTEVNVVDQINPVISAVETFIVNLNEEGEYILSAEDVDLGSTDNCTSFEDLTFEFTPSTFDCSNQGDDINVTYTISDLSGNSSSVDILVSVVAFPAPEAEENQLFCNFGTLADIEIEGENIKWYPSATSNIELPAETDLVSGVTYFATQTLNTCESITRTPVTIEIFVPEAPEAPLVQDFCNFATPNELAVTGVNVLWYTDPQGGEPLPGDFNLSNNTSYYASQTIDGCESIERFEILVTIQTPEAPTGFAEQSFCNNATVGQLTVNGNLIKWYADETGGSPLASSTPLINGAVYYASQTLDGCESLGRFAVNVILNTPQAAQIAAVAPVCSGDNLFLSVQNPVSGVVYQWSGPFGFNAVGSTVVYPNANLSTHNGEYTVTAVVNGCAAPVSEPVLVVVNQIPQANAGTDIVFCAGSDSNLAGVASGSTDTWTLISGPTGVNLNDLVVEVNNPTSPLNPNAPIGNYVLRITADNGFCSSNSQVNVRVNDVPQITLNGPTEVCVDTDYTYTAIASGMLPSETFTLTYSINGGESEMVSGLGGLPLNFTVNFGSEPGEKNLEVLSITNNNTTCSTADAAELTVLAGIGTQPEITVNTSGTLCEGGSLTVFTNVTGGSVNNYTWLVNGVNQGINTGSATFSSLSAGDEIVVEVSANGSCIGNITVSSNPIEILGLPEVNVGEPISFCVGSEANLMGSSTGTTNTWTLLSGPAGVNISDLVLEVNNPASALNPNAQAGTYVIQLTAANESCTDENQVTVVVNELPQVVITGPTTVCVDTEYNYSIAVSGIGSNQPFTAEFTVNGGEVTTVNGIGTLPVTFPVIFTGEEASQTIQIVSVTNSTTGCETVEPGSLLVNVEQGTTPELSINTSGSTCEGELLTIFTNISGGTATQFNWFVNGVNQGFATGSASFNQLQAGDLITVEVSANGSCIGNFTLTSNAIEILQTPEVSAGNDLVIIEGQEAQLNATATEGTIIEWSPAGTLNNAAILNPIATPMFTTFYGITATLPNGCSAFDEVMVEVKKALEFNFNTFTPDGDGVNDVWVIEGIEQYPNAQISIRNRWGDLVYNSVGYVNPWDGTNSQTGEALPIGSYYYTINLGVGTKDLNGIINIVR